MSHILYLIIIEPIQLIIEIVYTLMYRLLGSPGLAIPAVSVVVNLLVLPMYKRADAIQEEERARAKRMEPWITHIKKTFSGNEQYMMLNAYYRVEHFTPVKSLRTTLSLLLQIPFFIAAYNYLSGLSVLQDASFLTITNLGAPDGALFLFGHTFNLLPILMTMINVIAGYVYLRGAPFREKLQTYGIAAIFLILLYNSPAGLVLYWTCNQVFSLVKNIVMQVMKVRNQNAKTERTAVDATRENADSYNASKKNMAGSDRNTNNTRKHKGCTLLERSENDTQTFFMSAIFIAVLQGILIPSALIASSPQEFIDLANFVNPLVYIGRAFCIAVGLYVLWGGVMYFMAKPATRPKVTVFFYLWSIMSIFNYMFFGKDYGRMSPLLIFDEVYYYGKKLVLLNLFLIILIWIILLLIRRKNSKLPFYSELVLAVAALCLSGTYLIKINAAAVSLHETYSDVAERDSADVVREHDKVLRLSKTEKNVVVLVLDRFFGGFIPYMIQEKPLLRDQFQGFTYYHNTVSTAYCTMMATPALYGGYEYTPENMNRRSDELLVDKHDEALKMLPNLFSNHGYEVTVCDPPMAGYEWVPKLEIYDDLPGVNACILEGKYRDDLRGIYIPQGQGIFERNLFQYAVFKTAPYGLQGFIYDGGQYLSLEKVPEVPKTFVDSYSVLINLNNITETSNAFGPQAILMHNNTPHEPTRLQMPNYTISATVPDNTAYEDPERFVLPDGSRMIISEGSDSTYKHYEVDMAALLRVGEWLDYLRELDVYDNTRIIILSDHAKANGNFEELILADEYDAEAMHALLMVKDFGEDKPFTTSEEFMTVADTPTLAVEGLIDAPMNPYTGKALTNQDKELYDWHVTFSKNFDIYRNTGNVFDVSDAPWFSVHDNIWDQANWEMLPGEPEN